MAKTFNSVDFQRERREELSREYNKNPGKFVKTLREKYAGTGAGKPKEKDDAD